MTHNRWSLSLLLTAALLVARMTSAQLPLPIAGPDPRLAQAALELSARFVEGATIVELPSGVRWAVGVGATSARGAEGLVDVRRGDVVASHRARREIVRLLAGSRITSHSRLGRSEDARGDIRAQFDEQLVEDLAGTLIGVETIASGERADGVRWVAVACPAHRCIVAP